MHGRRVAEREIEVAARDLERGKRSVIAGGARRDGGAIEHVTCAVVVSRVGEDRAEHASHSRVTRGRV